MNVFLVPYLWTRHFMVGVFCSIVALLAWWGFLVFAVQTGSFWAPEWDGALLLGLLSASIAGASVLAESLLRRRALGWLLLSTMGAAAVSGALAVGFYFFWNAVLAPKVVAPLVSFGLSRFGLFTGFPNELPKTQLDTLTAAVAGDVKTAGLVSLRYRFGAFVLAGLATSIGPLGFRKFKGILEHLGAGLLAGIFAGAAWHLSHTIDRLPPDLYHASLTLTLVWAFTFGLFSWGIPDALYAGWIRVLSANRFGRRIPVDALDGLPKERFVGHYPRGLDLFLPLDEGVQELHVSVAVDSEQHYFARGLTLAPVKIRRFLESVDLRYDPRRAAPLETRIASGDRILCGEGQNQAVLEFVMLPREER